MKSALHSIFNPAADAMANGSLVRPQKIALPPRSSLDRRRRRPSLFAQPLLSIIKEIARHWPIMASRALPAQCKDLSADNPHRARPARGPHRGYGPRRFRNRSRPDRFQSLATLSRFVGSSSAHTVARAFVSAPNFRSGRYLHGSGSSFLVEPGEGMKRCGELPAQTFQNSGWVLVSWAAQRF